MNWINILILILITIGHTQLWVAAMNRLHSLPISHERLRQWRYLHDVAIPLIPLWMFWRIGWTGPQLLFENNWFELSLVWKSFSLICLIGFAGLVFSVIRHSFETAPEALLDYAGTTFDIAEELGYKPIGHGPYQSLAYIPFNEQFHLELTTTRIQLKHLPPAWEPLSILHVSDAHLAGTVSKEYFIKICEHANQVDPDLVVFTGDLLDDQSCLDWFDETFDLLQAPLGRFYILGNHDEALDPVAIRERLQEKGWIDVAGKIHHGEIKGVPIEIGGSEVPWMGAHPDWSLQPDSQAAFRLLLSHSPDYFKWARSHHVDLMLSGHNHGGQIRLPFVGPVYSPSRTGCRYASGTFQADDSVLHVTRGISGQHPLRWNCMPEITNLILTRAPE